MRATHSDKSLVNWSLGLLVLTSLLMACGGKAVQDNSLNVPEWFQNPPEDPSIMFSIATSTSKDMQMSINKAKQQARVDLAQQMETKIKAMTKQFSEEVGLGEDAEFLSQTTEVSKSVTSKVLTGSRANKVKTIKEPAKIPGLELGSTIVKNLVQNEAPKLAAPSSNDRKSAVDSTASTDRIMNGKVYKTWPTNMNTQLDRKSRKPP